MLLIGDIFLHFNRKKIAHALADPLAGLEERERRECRPAGEEKKR